MLHISIVGKISPDVPRQTCSCGPSGACCGPCVENSSSPKHVRHPHLHIDGNVAHKVHMIPVDQAAVRAAQYGGVERRHVLHVRLAGELGQVEVIALPQNLALAIPCGTVDCTCDKRPY